MTTDLTCAACRDLLPQHVAGVLSTAEDVAARQHLATCAECRRVAAQWSAIAETLAEDDARIPPDTDEPGSWLALRDRLTRQSPDRSAPVGTVRLMATDGESREHRAAPIVTAVDQRRTAPRPLIALLAALLLISLSATLLGLFGAQVRRGAHPTARATSVPTAPACAPSALSATLPPYADIASVSMVSAHDGWAVGQLFDLAHDATPPRPLLLRFQGCHWAPVKAAPGALTAPAQLVSVAMDSASDGWAIGSTLKDAPSAQPNGAITHQWIGAGLLVLHYTGGQWRRVDVPAGDAVIGAKVVMRSPSEGWMLIDGGKSHTGPYTAVYAYELFHYLNGVWSPVPLTFDSSKTLLFWDLAAAAPGECWLVGYGATSGDHFAVARYSSGAWRTWSPEQVGAGGATLYGIALPAPGDVWVVGSYGYQDASGDHSGPFISHYSGDSWVRQQLPAATASQAQINEDLTISHVAMLSPTEGWAFIGASGLLDPSSQAEALRYMNGQWRWAPLPSPLTVVRGLSLFSPTQGFGVAETHATMTNNSSGQVAPVGQLLFYDNGAWSLIPTR